MTDETGRGEGIQDRPYDDDTAGTDAHNRRIDYVEPKFDATFDGEVDPTATQPPEPTKIKVTDGDAPTPGTGGNFIPHVPGVNSHIGDTQFIDESTPHDFEYGKAGLTETIARAEDEDATDAARRREGARILETFDTRLENLPPKGNSIFGKESREHRKAKRGAVNEALDSAIDMQYRHDTGVMSGIVGEDVEEAMDGSHEDRQYAIEQMREEARLHDQYADSEGQRAAAQYERSHAAAGTGFMRRFEDHEPSMGHEPDGPTGESAEQDSVEMYHFEPEKFDRETVERIKREIDRTPGATWAVKKIGELLEEQAKLRSWSEEFSGKVPKEWGEVDRGAPWHKILEDIRNQEFKLTDDMIRAAITHPVPWVAGELVEKRSLTAEQQRLVEAEPGLPSWVSDRMKNDQSEIAEPDQSHDEWLRQQRDFGSN